MFITMWNVCVIGMNIIITMKFIYLHNPAVFTHTHTGNDCALKHQYKSIGNIIEVHQNNIPIENETSSTPQLFSSCQDLSENHGPFPSITLSCLNKNLHSKSTSLSSKHLRNFPKHRVSSCFFF